jgi:hypothetical protein
MMELLKDRYKIGLLMAGLFFLGIIASLYSIYALPQSLMLADGYQDNMVNVYLVTSATFVIGALAIWLTLNHKNEVIVFREKTTDKSEQSESKLDESKTTITLDNVKNSIKQAKGSKELLQAGIHAICKQLEAGQGAVYIAKEESGIRKVELKAGYALSIGESTVIKYEFGEGLIGQSAAGAKTLYVDEVPEGYVKILSGLGSASPRYLLIVPMKKEEKVIGVVEIASFSPISDNERKFVEESAQLIAGSVSGD